jgi:deazaflavin-dependent oxidoreductase (nitroreductase family)
LTKRGRWARSVRGRNEGLAADDAEVSDAHGGRMSAKARRFDAPSPFERIFSRLFGTLVGLGLGLPHNYLLQVRGRKSGSLYSTPVDVLERGGRRFLVAGRGETQWVRNARASGQVTLRKGRRAEACRLRALSDAEKPEVLKAYLDRFKMTVQRYFPIPAGSPVEHFAPVAAGYPVFELMSERRA